MADGKSIFDGAKLREVLYSHNDNILYSRFELENEGVLICLSDTPEKGVEATEIESCYIDKNNTDEYVRLAGSDADRHALIRQLTRFQDEVFEPMVIEQGRRLDEIKKGGNKIASDQIIELLSPEGYCYTEPQSKPEIMPIKTSAELGRHLIYKECPYMFLRFYPTSSTIAFAGWKTADLNSETVDAMRFFNRNGLINSRGRMDTVFRIGDIAMTVIDGEGLEMGIPGLTADVVRKDESIREQGETSQDKSQTPKEPDEYDETMQKFIQQGGTRDPALFKKLIGLLKDFSPENALRAYRMIDMSVFDIDNEEYGVCAPGGSIKRDCVEALEKASLIFVGIGRVFNGWVKQIKDEKNKKVLVEFKNAFAREREKLEAMRVKYDLPKSITAAQVKDRPGAGCSVAGGYEAETIRLTWDDIVYGLKMLVGD